MDQPGKVVNPARGQLNRKHDFIPVPVHAWEFSETGSAVLFRVSLLIIHTQVALLFYAYPLTHGIPPDSRGGVHLFII